MLFFIFVTFVFFFFYLEYSIFDFWVIIGCCFVILLKMLGSGRAKSFGINKEDIHFRVLLHVYSGFKNQ